MRLGMTSPRIVLAADPVAALQQRIDSGKVKLVHHEERLSPDQFGSPQAFVRMI